MIFKNLYFIGFLLCICTCYGLKLDDHFEYNKEIQIKNGEEEFKLIKLPTPVHFFSDTYDHVYLNTRGILTFASELPNFSNIPFPLEFASIAPFYSNVDTTNAGPETSVSFSIIPSERNVQKTEELIRQNFAEGNDFRATNVYIATWENVGFFRGNQTLKNTYQTVIICGDDETFVAFLYPQNGLNWLQGEPGDSGLPDVRAQAGFIAEDGRIFLLKGSGTDNAKYLNQLSNVDIPGLWLYRVGHLQYEDSIEEPDKVHSIESLQSLQKTCSAGGRLKCHINAICTDTSTGFCCKCVKNFYGNGFNCIKNDAPIRVAGKLTGQINDVEIESQIQSYVVLNDGRSYTSISPLPQEIGNSTQLLISFGNVIGWLFAKPVGDDNVPNGYQLTGGKLNHTTLLRFENTNEEIIILQKFDGLNVWDQLSVNISVRGRLPIVSPNAIIEFPDITDELVFQSEEILRSTGRSNINIDGKNIGYSIEQTIEFDKCRYSDIQNDLSPIFSQISHITSQYKDDETALRIATIHKVNRNTPVNKCTDGSASCGANAICIPDPLDDSFSCECKNGFTLFESESSQVCVDIDECSNINICDENANCINELGGYSCRCRNGYVGNGYICRANAEISTTTSSNDDQYKCSGCSENAECFQGVCACKNGWHGDGIECTYNCEDNFVWSFDQCVPIDGIEEEEHEVQPFCHTQGCSCPTDYELVETESSKICRLAKQPNESISEDNNEEESDEDSLPCDVNFNCHQNAKCEWFEAELRNKCVCDAGYEGNGHQCVEREVSCLYENVCDVHASCEYDEDVGKSICKCNKGYEGNGKSCNIAPECSKDEECSDNSSCDSGVCICKSGYERDVNDYCVPTGYCGGTFCAQNAICQWDNLERISYCHCPEGFEGDGVQQCKSIPPPCNLRNNCGLNAQCLPKLNSSEYECVCDSGYYGDGLVCIPEVNCRNVPSLCHDNGKCVSTNAGYQCVCEIGYIGNGSDCQLPAQVGESLLLSQGVAIVKVLFERKPSLPISMASMAIGIDKDCSHGRVYWSDISLKQIFTARYNGSDKRPFITEDIESPEGIAVDWVSRRIYWTDSKKDTVEVASLDDPTVRSVIINTSLVNPRGIAVDPRLSKLFWSDWNRDAPKIEWSNLDGSQREIILTSPILNLPNSLAISQRTGELCYADAGTHKIECVEPNQRTVRTIATNSSYPFGLAITQERFYWTDWATKKIESTDQYGAKYPSLSSPLFGNHKMYGLTTIGGECPLFYSPCLINNGDCPSGKICLVNPSIQTGQICQ